MTFPFTVGENVACSGEYEEKRVWEALEKAGVHKKIKDLSAQLNAAQGTEEQTVTGLSGGEKQKVVIARAMYKDAVCMVLDEPASALDAVSENQLYQSFAELTKGKLGILVSHRMSSCTFCDSILVLEDGQICGEGCHRDLLQHNALYRTMWNTQAKYYLEQAQS